MYEDNYSNYKHIYNLLRKNTMKEIYFIRHGETDINRDNKFYDDRVNIGINSKGVNQA
jgi:hypothetical protein